MASFDSWLVVQAILRWNDENLCIHNLYLIRAITNS